MDMVVAALTVIGVLSLISLVWYLVYLYKSSQNPEESATANREYEECAAQIVKMRKSLEQSKRNTRDCRAFRESLQEKSEEQ